ncbi:MAG: DUF438 domain-containing protein [Bryobacterales bacterium]|nr:DUF438 domain-containing protein [Bryobacterales bacterium]
MSELIDNRTQRVRTLKEIIQRLHKGEAPDAVRGSLRQLVRETDYSEIAEMEQQLIDEGMPVAEVMGMCDLHSQVTREILVQLQPAPLAAGHPVETMRRENAALVKVLERLNRAMTAVQDATSEQDAAGPVMEWRQALNELQDVDKHYQRKEHLFFTCLERHQVMGPPKVMWGKDDEVRELLKDLSAALRERDTSLGELKLLAATTGVAAAAAVQEMIYKEEQILLPLCQGKFTAQDWGEIWASSPRYGWCLVEPGQDYNPPEGPVKEGAAQLDGIALPTGTLTLEQLRAIFEALPVDLTFVDADDRVAFFSEGKSRLFSRSKAIIGRKVQNCHPPRSVDIVERILADFRGGRQSVAEFWIPFHGQFVHIRYFAVRDSGGRYAGTLEVTQDVTKIRALEGQRRLLEYDEPVTARTE